MNIEKFLSEKKKSNTEKKLEITKLYEFENIIGKGSFGTIWKCRKKCDGTICAIKVNKII